MPFNSSGVYTPATGALTASPGALIQSAVWNAINADYTAALTSLGQQVYGLTNVGTTPYIPLSTDTFIGVNIASASVVNLPTGASRNGYPLAIKDLSGAAQTNNITINRNGGDTIEGLTSIVINTAYGGYNLFPVASGWVIHP
jgi:hypothetical protein